MSLKLDVNNLPEEYTFILSRRNHYHYGQLVNITNVNFKNNLASANEISFDIYKEFNGHKELFWEYITDFKFVYVIELNEYYEIKVDVSDGFENIKSITGVSACECELSQSIIYGLEINTDIDISRENYSPTVLYNEMDHKTSLLHRALSKLPNYSIEYVDPSIAKIQRTFNVDGKSIYDFLTEEVSNEIGCLFVFDSVNRSMSVYDLNTVCTDCGHRGEYDFTCPKCGSKNLKYYGEDTVIYVDSENLADNITFTTDTDSVKNCFKLEAGDDNMTAAITNSNPNGSGYIYYFSKEQKNDMSKELVDKINAYDTLFESKQIQYSELMQSIYDCIDKIVYYTSSMMPKIENDSTNSQKESLKLTEATLSPLGLPKVETSTSLATVNSALKNYVKIFINSGKFKIEVNNGRFEYVGVDTSGNSYGQWYGNFKITNYSDEEDIAYSPEIKVKVYDLYQTFLEQKIKKKISSNDDDGSIFNVLEITDINKFKEALTYYCLNRLTSFYDAIQSVIDIMIEEDQVSPEASFYSIYIGYKNKLDACQTEVDARNAVINQYETLKNEKETLKKQIQTELDFEKYLGQNLYNEFCCYRREDKYSNSNYVSDGLDNNEILKKALEFIEAAKKEIYKSGEYQHSITANLYNLLAMKEFKPLASRFKLGNWIRVRVDEDVYRLRLISYEVSFDNIETIDVVFSDVLKIRDGVVDLQSILNQSSSMASSYDSVSHQVKNDSDKIKVVDGWVQNGLDATNTLITNDLSEQSIVFDKHGFLCRKYDDIEEQYDDCQLKIINNGLYITSDNWKTINTALGKYCYIDPITNKMTFSYGLQAKQIVGEMIIGEKIKIKSKDSSFSIDENGVKFGVSSVEEVLDKLDKSIKSVTVEYYVSDSNTFLTGGVWSSSSPEFIVGKYIWTRQKITYSDNSTKTENVACISSSNGKSIKGVVEEYVKTNSPTEKPTDGWSEVAPDWENGFYIWTRSRIIYADDSEYASLPVCVTGNDGKDAVNYNVEILSTNGSVFRNGNIETVLSCKVYKNNEDITDLIPTQNFHWEKINNDGTLDKVWIDKYLGGTKSVTITKDDVLGRATFNCKVDGLIK